MEILRPTEHETESQTQSLLITKENNQESKEMSLKRQRSSSIEMSEEKSAKAFRKSIVNYNLPVCSGIYSIFPSKISDKALCYSKSSTNLQPKLYTAYIIM